MSTNNMVEPAKPLKLLSINGFAGAIPQGLLRHPDGEHLIYPLGSNVVIRHETTKQQTFMSGHSNMISCITMSKCGRWVATGQVTYMGFPADIILWDFRTRTLHKKFSLHKGRVESLCFSSSSRYLASLGGQDDNSLIIWDLSLGKAICGTGASKNSSGTATCVRFFNCSDVHLVTGGQNTLRVWEIVPDAHKCVPSDCQLGQIKRVVRCITIDAEDDSMYCGTTTGDILQVNLKSKLFKLAGPSKEKDLFHQHVETISLTPDKKQLLVGAGDGTIALVKMSNLTILNRVKVQGGVTSITCDFVNAEEKTFLASTSLCNVYKMQLSDLKAELMTTCHSGQVNDIAFPKNYSELYATGSVQDVRIWNAFTSTEILRIHIPNLECYCLTFNQEGSSLITGKVKFIDFTQGWSDGKIRAFGPETGRIQYEINDAHHDGVTAIATTETKNGLYHIISGGEDGQVRIWKITKQVQLLEQAMKEHKGTVTCIKIRNNNLECVSSSSDGSCVIWDLSRHVRNQVLFAPSFFKNVCYYPDESQLITSGTDRKIAYWEAFDGSLIRELECESDSLSGLDISLDGKLFVSGGSDKLVKVYRYEEGDVVFEGQGHSSEITKIKISPDQKMLISVGADGSIFTWQFSQ